MAAPYILARTFADAHAFAKKDLGLGAGHYRVVNSSGTLKAVRGVTLYLVPGWRNRFDRFAMQSALRWTRMDVIDVAETPVQAPEPTGEPDGLEPAGVQLTLVTEDEAHTFVVAADDDPKVVPELLALAEQVVEEDFEDEAPPTPPSTDEPVEAPQEQAPEKPKKNRRRRRCKDCGSLHFKEDACIPSESV